jgi:hypothetical protein
MRRVILVLPLLLAACTQGPSLQSRMAAYIGAPEDKLVQSMGVPDKHITVNGVQYLAYVQGHAQVMPSDFAMGGPYWGPYWGPYYGPYYYAGLPQDVQVWSCEITFTLKDGKVTGFTLKGNDCD